MSIQVIMTLKVKKLKSGFVYILKGKYKGYTNYYIGSTKRTLEERFREHRKGLSIYTSKMTDIELTFYFEVPLSNVRSVEYFLKRHRHTVYSFVGKKKATKREENFFNWLKLHSIKLYSFKKIGEKNNGKNTS